MSRKRYLVKLNSVEDVQYFNAKLCTLDGDFDLGCGRYVIDAKSIMGIFSLDLSKELLFVVHSLDVIEEVKERVGKFIVREVSECE